MTDSEVAQLIERIESLRRELVLRSETQDKALQIQSKEYERRLTDLNHENERVAGIQGHCISRENYEIQHKVLLDRVDSLESYKDMMTGKADQSSVNRVLILSAIGVILSVLGIVLGFMGI